LRRKRRKRRTRRAAKYCGENGENGEREEPQNIAAKTAKTANAKSRKILRRKRRERRTVCRIVTMTFQRILIANRGEIAVRIIRACRELGISPVAVYSAADAEALHVRLADLAVPLGPAPAAQSYLRTDAIIAAAQATEATAIHPGYGFLAENADFARRCAAAGITFIGPPPSAIEAMGGKIGARALARAAGVPIVPGYDGADQSLERLLHEADLVGYPLLIKASAGGGGKGMRIVRSAAEFPAALEGARREAQAAFGDAAVFLEHLVPRPRHIEIQVFADAHGNVVHLGERECSIQRRHQKILEESPAPGLSAELRTTMGAAAVRLAHAAGYVNAGTVEFVLDSGTPQPDGALPPYYFLEMNTRLQVEHPVTELVTGLDLVQLQIAVAAGAALPFRQADIQLRGHAIEARIYAEDPVTFLPAIGRIELLDLPQGPGVRVDGGLTSGDEVTVHYDPLIAKLIVQGADRPAAVQRLARALADTSILGLTTNLPLLHALAQHPAFAAGDTHTGFLTEHPLAVQPPAELPPVVLIAAALWEWHYPAHTTSRSAATDPFAIHWRIGGVGVPMRYLHATTPYTLLIDQHATSWTITIQGMAHQCTIQRHSANEIMLVEQATLARVRIARTAAGDLLLAYAGHTYRLSRPVPLSTDSLHRHGDDAGDAGLLAPMPGTLVQLLVREGDVVVEGQPLAILEAMKMEHTIIAPYAGQVVRVPYAAGSSVTGGVALVEIAPTDAA
jgi:3-methylcrotonyl-CoA carboxylase alpha subunit